MKIAVFCSSSLEVSPMFASEIEQLGEMLASDGHAVIYGGTTTGCMGALARGVKARRGALIGVVPKMDFMEGIVEPDLSEQVVVANLSLRKTAMIERADAFLVYPGGLGTLDEALEVLTLKSLGNLRKKMVFYNFLGTWTPFLESLELLYEQRFIRQPLHELVGVVDNLKSLRENLRDAL